MARRTSPGGGFDQAASAGVSVQAATAGDFGIADRLFAGSARRRGRRSRLRLPCADQVQRCPLRTARRRASATGTGWIRARSPGRIARCRRCRTAPDDDQVAAALQRRRVRLLDDDLADAEQLRHHRDAEAESDGEHRRAQRPRGQRSQREPENHCDQPPALHRQPPRRARGQRRVVRDDEDGRAVRVDAIEQRRDVLAVSLVELARRLVGDEQRRPVGQRARDRDALHLAARELRGQMIGAIGQTHVFEQLARPRRAARRPRRRLRPAAAPRSRAAVSIGSRKKRWKTKPMRVRRMRLRSASDKRATSRSSKSIDPLVGVSTQPIRCSSVDLPQPDGPVIAT